METSYKKKPLDNFMLGKEKQAFGVSAVSGVLSVVFPVYLFAWKAIQSKTTDVSVSCS